MYFFIGELLERRTFPLVYFNCYIVWNVPELCEQSSKANCNRLPNALPFVFLLSLAYWGGTQYAKAYVTAISERTLKALANIPRF